LRLSDAKKVVSPGRGGGKASASSPAGSIHGLSTKHQNAKRGGPGFGDRVAAHAKREKPGERPKRVTKKGRVGEKKCEGKPWALEMCYTAGGDTPPGLSEKNDGNRASRGQTTTGENG